MFNVTINDSAWSTIGDMMACSGFGFAQFKTSAKSHKIVHIKSKNM